MFKYILYSFFIAFVLYSSGVKASPQSTYKFNTFSVLPVLDNGRVQPLEKFARTYLKRISGEEKLQDMNAIEWLVETLFDPALAIEKPIILIKNSELQKRLGIDTGKNQRFSYATVSTTLVQTLPELQKILKKANDRGSISAGEQGLIDLHEKLFLYTQLLRSFSYALPLNIGVSYKDVVIERAQLRANLDVIIQKKGNNVDAYTGAEKAIATLLNQMADMQDAGARQDIFKVIPLSWKNENEWTQPWAIYTQGAGSPQVLNIMNAWEGALHAYRDNDTQAWNKQTKNLMTLMETSFPKAFTLWKLRAEILTLKYPPLILSIFALFAYFLCAISAQFKPFRHIEKATKLFVPLILGLQAVALVARIIILGRPPVGTLNESVLFVAFIVGCVAVLFSLIKKQKTLVHLGLFLNLVLLLIAFSLGAHNEFPLLDAVLNTNLWLGIHVLCITIGYAWCLLSSVLSQYALYKTPIKSQQFFSGLPKLFLLISLLFVSVGTALGGIWADQSWGRFWGWDPKENGALLIILWIVWISHGLLSGHIKPFWAHILNSFLSVIVACAWFGVNLLNVGLHSYGFVSGIAGGLFAFVALQSTIIIILVQRAKRTEKAKTS